MLNLRNASYVFAFLSLATVIACGGGGGGSNGGIVDPAPDPTCGSIALPSAQNQAANNLAQLQGPNIVVPESTISRASDAGIRAHTNHLIYTGATGRLSGPSGLSPQQLYQAYGVPGNLGSGAIAIVDAFHYPTSLNDFNVFSSQFGLPTEPSSSATSSSNTVFQVVYATGSQPATDGSWSQEMAIDTQWAHAMAPNAKIYLVEAASATVSDLMAAVNVAKALPGVKQVSLSFGATESACNFVHYDPNLLQAGVTFFAASGDTSDERNFPALSKNAIAVGGTTLVLDVLNNRSSENSWSKTAGNLSLFEPRQTFQDVVVSSVQRYRGAADLAAVGDPATGVAVYDSTSSGGLSGWLVFGGTSVSCPIIAGITNAAGNSYASSKAFNAHLYSLLGTDTLFDVKHGTSGSHSAGIGWDFLSGVGAPNGLAGF